MNHSDVSALITVQQAIALIDSIELHPRIVDVPLAEAQGHRLAVGVVADRDYPPFDRSLMDGIAVRCADVTPVPATLRIVGSVAAGQSPHGGLGAGEAMMITTGAPIPPEADGVIPLEDLEHDGKLKQGATVRVVRATAPPRYLARQGSDAEKGQVVLRAGLRLEAPQLAVAATVGATTLKVFAAPRVGVLCTGDELVPPESSPAGAQIRNANGVLMMALLKRMGCRVVDLGIVPDKPDVIRRAMLKGLHLEALVVTGGMSVGDHDYVPGILGELGIEPRITRVRIKPGKPFVFAVADRAKVLPHAKVEAGLHKSEEGQCYIFGLPGNPVSGFVCLMRLASRLLTRLEGGQVIERWVNGKLLAPLPANGPREFYQPATVDYATGSVWPLNWKGSGDVFTLALANALIIRAENEPAQDKGALVRVMEV